MRCAAPTELNYTIEYYCYKGLAPPELQPSPKGAIPL